MDIMTSFNRHQFVDSGYFAYDASEDVIHYDGSELGSNQGRLSLLHEISHAELGHFSFINDFELLIMEAQAWHLTKQLSSDFAVEVDDAYIQACIDTYDHWLSKRSCCPDCKNFCLPTKNRHVFTCFLCGCRWEASTNPHEPASVAILT